MLFSTKMYSAVRTHDFEYPESEMDDRESLYFDTISLAESEAAAAYRKSLSQSRNTVYHSAVDLADNETPSKRGNSLRFENSKSSANNIWNTNYRHSSALDSFNGNGNEATQSSVKARGAIHNGDYTDAAIAAQVNALQNGRGGISSPQLYMDEVSGHLLQSNTNPNKDKKLPITYSQWKVRTRRKFLDGKRCVDFVLAYNGDDHKLDNLRKRETFEANLEKEGLHLERDNTQRIHFIKLHAPTEVLCRYAEVLKIKLPMKKIPGQELIYEKDFEIRDRISECTNRLCASIRLDPEKFPPREPRIFCEFSRTHMHLFDWEDPNFFDATVRNSIINFILERQNFVKGEETADNLGIEKLLEDGVYDSAYTLHDDSDRELLLSEWANLKKWINIQPLDNIKEYFGAKVALYFAWLGFYTNMLIPLSVFGILCFIYGFITWNTDPISRDICDGNQTTLMCPQCDRNCDFWELKKTCSSSRMNYLLDNNITIVFSFVMSVWAVLYLELWKRYSAGLVHRWGLTGFSQHVEHPRPQYLSKLRKTKVLSEKLDATNSVLEPDVPFWKIKFLPSFTSYSIMVLFICISLIAIFALIVYRMAQTASHSILGDRDSMTYKIMVLPMTAGILDLIVISLLDYAYSMLAVYLTNLEYCRTQTEYDGSLTIKNYVFQFVNYYSSLFYIAFLKSKFVGYPSKYNRVLGFRQEECNPGGCLMELCLQLVIIMVGKQAVNAIVEMLIPYLMRTYRKYFQRRNRNTDDKLIACNQWTEDYHLVPFTSNSMFVEYLEMVLQFGFVTLFGLAFPLAPLLALINNIFEVRLDAIKLLKLTRRPVAQRASNIGVWYNIMTIVTKIAVCSSAMIIAFSTNLIPKIVYRSMTQDESLDGFLDFTLAHFNTGDFQVQPLISKSPYVNVTSCRYSEFRNPPWHEQPYKRPMFYWKIFTGRLAFIVIYQNVIGIIQAIVAWAVPDVPSKLQKRIKREEFLLREHIIDYEKKTAAEKAAARLELDAGEVEYRNSMYNNQRNGNVDATSIQRQRDNQNRNSNSNYDEDHITPV